jgi:polyisoprenoid-binding protein YceI
MYKALKAEKFPNIEFRLSDTHLLPALIKEGVNQLTSNGVLTIAGKENVIKMDAQFELLPDGIHIFGTKPLLMSDYGVKPPTILGVIKVKDDVTIHFDLILGLRS